MTQELGSGIHHIEINMRNARPEYALTFLDVGGPLNVGSTLYVSSTISCVEGMKVGGDLTVDGSASVTGAIYGAVEIITLGDTIRIETQRTPSSATARGTKGDIVHDTDYIYVCIGANTWKRTAISTW